MLVAYRSLLYKFALCLHCVICCRPELWDAAWCLQMLAVALQSRISESFHVDIHPAATFGRGILLDHATGESWMMLRLTGDDVRHSQDAAV
jgi:serine acetyltransferase